jgi:hypothetical protein
MRAALFDLDVAPFTVALEHATGTRVEVLRKPAPAFFEAALSRLGGALRYLMKP